MVVYWGMLSVSLYCTYMILCVTIYIIYALCLVCFYQEQAGTCCCPIPTYVVSSSDQVVVHNALLSTFRKSSMFVVYCAFLFVISVPPFWPLFQICSLPSIQIPPLSIVLIDWPVAYCERHVVAVISPPVSGGCLHYSICVKVDSGKDKSIQVLVRPILNGRKDYPHLSCVTPSKFFITSSLTKSALSGHSFTGKAFWEQCSALLVSPMI